MCFIRNTHVIAIYSFDFLVIDVNFNYLLSKFAIGKPYCQIWNNILKLNVYNNLHNCWMRLSGLNIIDHVATFYVARYLHYWLTLLRCPNQSFDFSIIYIYFPMHLDMIYIQVHSKNYTYKKVKMTNDLEQRKQSCTIFSLSHK